MRIWIPACALLCAASLPAQVPGTDAWHNDLQLLARELPVRHPAAFANITRAQWDSAVTSLAARMPRLSQNERVVEIFRLVALVGDAHTTVQPAGPSRMRYYPLELYQFEDGLFIRRADSAHRALVGSRVVRIGRLSAEEALASVGEIVSHENDWWVRSLGPFWLMVPEMLDGLDIVDDPERLSLVLERNGRRETVVVTPAGTMGHGNEEAFDTSRWVSMRTTVPPLYEQRRDQPFWWTLLPDNRTLYLSLRAVVPGPRSATNRAQWDQVFALADSARVERLIIDIRNNGGGNGGLNRYPVQQILRRPALDQRGRLFVITGRRTFSAAQQFANLLEAWTQALFVGEPTGQKPSQWGDHRALVLPNTQLQVMISTVYHQAPDEFDRRQFVPPALYTPLTSADYAAGIDPALNAILKPDSAPSIAEQVWAAVAGGDTGRAERILRTAQGAAINRFKSLEAEINTLGYQLLGRGAVEHAVQVLSASIRGSTRNRRIPSIVSGRRYSRPEGETRRLRLTGTRWRSSRGSRRRCRRWRGWGFGSDGQGRPSSEWQRTPVIRVGRDARRPSGQGRPSSEWAGTPVVRVGRDARRTRSRARRRPGGTLRGSRGRVTTQSWRRSDSG